jgi:hypothetical protein
LAFFTSFNILANNFLPLNVALYAVSIKGMLSMKDNIIISSLLALGIILIPLGVVVLLSLSYGMLFGINYLLESSVVINLAPFKIEITHVLLGAVFLAVMFKSDSQSSKAIEHLEKSLSSELNNLTSKMETLSIDLTELQDINRNLESIENHVGDIRREIESDNS